MSNLKWVEDADCPENVIYTVNAHGYRIPFYIDSVVDRMAPFLTDALIGDKDAYDSLSNLAHHHHPEYLPAVRAIKEKYGYAD